MLQARGAERGRDEPVLRGIAAILLAGALLGLGYNWLRLQNPRAGGLSWIAEDLQARLASMEVVRGEEEPAGETEDPYYTDSSDPLAVAGPVAADPVLPEIPAAGRPVQIELGALRQYVDAGGALLLDARDAYEFEQGHIPGAINLPYDLAVTDPERLERLDTGGRPIVAYCGGGECEVSISLAYELLAAGHERVAVYMGGFPEWEGAGLPVARGGEGR